MLKNLYNKLLNFISAPLVKQLESELDESNKIINDITNAIKPFTESTKKLREKLDKDKNEKDLIIEKLFVVIDEMENEKRLINSLDPNRYSDLYDKNKIIEDMGKELLRYEFHLNILKGEREVLELKYKFGSTKIMKMRESLTFEQISKAIGYSINSIRTYVQSIDNKNLLHNK